MPQFAGLICSGDVLPIRVSPSIDGSTQLGMVLNELSRVTKKEICYQDQPQDI